MSSFNERGLVGVELPQEEEAEADATAGDDGAEEETSQARAAREVVVLDGDDDGRAPSPGPLVTYGPLDDSDAEGETVPLEAQLRRRAVYSDEVHGGADSGDNGEAMSSQRHRSEEAVEAGSSTLGGTTPWIGVMTRSWLFVSP